jgi:hypothetical protein
LGERYAFARCSKRKFCNEMLYVLWSVHHTQSLSTFRFERKPCGWIAVRALQRADIKVMGDV